MNSESSIVTKAESAIDDVFDLWRRRKGVCILVLLGIVCPTLFAFHQQLIAVPRLEDKLAASQSTVGDLKRELDKTELKLASFQAAADRAFPNREREERLDLLLSQLSQQIESIAKWEHAFRPLNPDDAQRFVSRLRDLASAQIAIDVRCESGSTTRRQYAEQLGAMLGAAGMGRFQDGTNVGVAPGNQVVCRFAPQHKNFVEHFFRLLESWTSCNLQLVPDESKEGVISIYINATPTFDHLGNVRMI